MARQTAKVEVNSFVRGLITEASALTFPDNASLDEDNFVLKRDGSRERRLGMDLEENYQTVSVDLGTVPGGEAAFSSFLWDNAGGIANKSLSVIQTGNILKIFDLDISPLSSGEIYSIDLGSADPSQIFSYAIVDGNLVVVVGQRPIHIFEYENGAVSRHSRALKIRDHFGVEDVLSGKDLTEDSGLIVRPSSITQAHTYNLRNQTWASPRRARAGNFDRQFADPITAFEDYYGSYPSNADAVTYSLGAWLEDGESEESFLVADLSLNPPGSFRAAQGFFIIDALERGQSRIEEAQSLYSTYPQLNLPIGNLPTDKTPGGPRAVAEYAGRVWYAGFSGSVEDGDNSSPRMSSYLLYSQLVQDPSDIVKCYQEGDPTSVDSPDLLDTDGGFIRVDGAYNIQKLVNVGSALMVVAENGVWEISGGSDYGFSATNNKRSKITDRGTDSPGSVVLVDNTFIYWADDGIYHVRPNEFGDWGAQSLTEQTIQTFFEDISPIDKAYAQGIYDSYDRKVRWTYQNRIQDTDEVKELVLDMVLGSFYTSTIQKLPNTSLPRPVCPVLVPPYRLVSLDENVVVQGEDVVVNGEPVTLEVSRRGSGTREVMYVTLLDTIPISYSFASYRDMGFRDWVSVDGEGVDAEAFLLTGYLSGGDFMRYKQVPYIQFYFNRTETGFTDDGTGNLFPVNPSSCLVQSQWEWANSANSNRWGRSFQAYRYRRHYMPSGPSDPFDTGFEVVTTKNKLRGKGKVLSLLIKTEPDKDCQLLGWSMILGINGNV